MSDFRDVEIPRLREKVEQLNAYVEEWKKRYETARLAHEDGRAEVERLREQVRTLTMQLDHQVGTPCEQVRHQQEIERWKYQESLAIERCKELEAEIERLTAERDKLRQENKILRNDVGWWRDGFHA